MVAFVYVMSGCLRPSFSLSPIRLFTIDAGDSDSEWNCLAEIYEAGRGRGDNGDRYGFFW